MALHTALRSFRDPLGVSRLAADLPNPVTFRD
jgi:hypothetical protein